MRFYILFLLIFLAGSFLPDIARAQDNPPLLEEPAPFYTPGSDTSEAIPQITLDELPKEKTREEKALERLSQLPPEIQKDMIVEGKKAEYYCHDNYMLSRFYDCECFGLTMMDERITQGPDMSFFLLINKGEYNNCVFEPAIAGYIYDRCYAVMYLDKLTDGRLDEICGCTGRSVAQSYKKRPYPDIKYVDSLFSQTLSSCRQTAKTP